MNVSVGRDFDNPAPLVLGCVYLVLIQLVAMASRGYGAYRAVVTLLLLVGALIMMTVPSILPAVTVFKSSKRVPLVAALFFLGIAIASVGTIHRFLVVQGIALSILTFVFYSEANGLLPVQRFKLPTLVVVAACVTVPLVSFLSGLLVPKLYDIATTTAKAGQVMLTGGNPYTELVDEGGKKWMADARFGGYKYSPLMAVFYIPFVSVFGAPGVLVGNLHFLLGAAVILYFLARRINASGPGLAVVLMLAAPFFAEQMLSMGATDIAAVLSILIAFLIWGRNATLVGLFIGLSLSTKLAPGLFAAAVFTPPRPRDWPRYALGIVIGLLPSMIYLTWSPEDFIRNIFVFQVIRPVESTSWQYFVPGWAAVIGRVILFTMAMLTVLFCTFTKADLYRRLSGFLVVTFCALLTGPMYLDNYGIWWIPVAACLVISVGRRPDEVAESRAKPSVENVPLKV